MRLLDKDNIKVGYIISVKHVELFAASTIAIVRHVKIRGDANPFDPAWDVYLARRAATR